MHWETTNRKVTAGNSSVFSLSRFAFLFWVAFGVLGMISANSANASCGAQSKKTLLIKFTEKEQAFLDNLSLSYSQPTHNDPTMPCRVPICKSQRDKGSPDPIKPTLIVRSFKFVMHTRFLVHVLHQDFSYAIADASFLKNDGSLAMIDRPPIVGLI